MPGVTSDHTFLILHTAVIAQDGAKLRWQRDHLTAPFLDLAEDQAPALTLWAPGCVSGAVGRAGILDHGADVPALLARPSATATIRWRSFRTARS
jgi:hypothetical protein